MKKTSRTSKITCTVDDCMLDMRRDSLMFHIKTKHSEYYDAYVLPDKILTLEKEFKMASSDS